MFKIEDIKVGEKFRYKDPAQMIVKHDKDKIEERIATCTKITYYDYYSAGKKSKYPDLPKLGEDLYIIEAIDDKNRKVYLSVNCKVDYNMETFFANEE